MIHGHKGDGECYVTRACNFVDQTATVQTGANKRIVRDVLHPVAVGLNPQPACLNPPNMGFYTSYYTYGLPTFIVIVVALYLLFTGALTVVEALQGY